MKKRAADIAIQALIEAGVTTAFSVVGGGAMHLNNAFALVKDELETVYCHHEQACAMAAEGYARYSGKMAAVCVTSGPGGINALNGVQGAWVDSIPMIVISGHPRYATTVPATGLKLRCRGVQENDIIRMVTGITKYAKQILDPRDVRMEVEKAADIAMRGRRGPVWLDIPLDVQGALVEEDELRLYIPDGGGEQCSNDVIAEVGRVLHAAKRPCILTGSGIRSGDVLDLYHQFAEKVRVPIVGGALRADINANGDARYYGMSGVIGPRIGNFILQSADVILVLGNSLSTTQTGFNQEAFAESAKLIMVDATEDETKKPGLHVDLPVCCGLREFFTSYLAKGESVTAAPEWFAHCDMLKKELPPYELLERNGAFGGKERIPALVFWKDLLQKMNPDAVITLGNSDSCVGVLQEGVNHRQQRVLVNYNCGSMGDDLPPAIGAAVASKKTVYCVTGDGSVMLNLQELETIVYHNYPIKLVIMNNDGYGTIRNTCTNYFHGLYAGCNEKSGLGFPDFEKVAGAFDISYRKCKTIDELDAATSWLVDSDGPCILEVMECIDEMLVPTVSSIMDENGVFTTPPLHIMTPLLPEEQLEKYIIRD